ncbi:hypothetical protein ACI2OX_12125 [Bacillus sp. N9]
MYETHDRATSYIEQNDLLQVSQVRLNNYMEVDKIELDQESLTNNAVTSAERVNEHIASKENQLSEAPIEVQNEQSVEEDTFTLDGSVYERIVSEEKFSHWIEVAERYDSKLYAIPFSDVFAIVKDKTPIVHMSTGVAAAEVKNAEILKELFSRDGFEEYEGIVENIDTVSETGKKYRLQSKIILAILFSKKMAG